MAFYNNVIAGAAGAGSGGDAAGFKVERSIRIDKPGTAYLSRTPASASNRRKWTWSGWVKQSNHDSDHHLFVGDTSTGSLSDTTFGRLYIEAGGAIRFSGYTTAYRTTNAVLRDCGAWYHIVCVVDTTLSTATDRIKIYLNGLRLTSFSTSNDPSQNAVLGWNQVSVHTIGARSRNGTIAHHHDGYLAEVHFLDGLAPGTATDDSSGTATGTPNAEYLTDFGEFDDAGFWRAKAFTGAHGPSLVNYHDNSQTDLPDGNVYLNTQPVENIFDGDDTTYARINRGTNSASNATFRWEPTGGYSGVTKIRIKTDYTTHYNINGGTFQSHTAQGWTQIYNGSAITLNTLQIRRDNASASDFGIFVYGIEINDTLIANINNNGFHLNFSDNSSNAALGTDSSGLSNSWSVNNIAGPGGDHVYSAALSVPEGGGFDTSFPAVNGFDGNTSTATLGANTSTSVRWTYSSSFGLSGAVEIYVSGASMTVTFDDGRTAVTAAADQYTQISSSVDFNWFNVYQGSGLRGNITAVKVGGTVLIDSTGANNDSLIDTPTNYTSASGNNRGNYCTLNPLDRQSTNGTLSNGNLDITQSLAAWAMYRSTMFVSSGKWYWELTIGNNQYTTIGICTDVYHMASASGNWVNGSSEMFGYYPYNGKKYNGGTNAAYATADTTASGSVIGVALDMDNGTLAFYKDGTSLGTAYTGLTGKNVSPTHWLYQGSNADSYNFGQRPFAISSVPAGYKSLCTTNLPDATITDGRTAMDIVTWTGDGGGARTISGLNLSGAPDLVWSKTRNHGYHNNLFDSVRGYGTSSSAVITDYNGSASGGTLNSATASSLTYSGGVWHNENAKTYIAWAWDGGDPYNSINTSTHIGGNWISMLSTESGTYTVTNPHLAFDGSPGNTSTTRAQANRSSEGAIVFTPTGGYTVNTQIRVYGGSASDDCYLDFGSGYGSAISLTSGAWTTVYSGSGTLTKMKFLDDGSGSVTGLGGIEIDGKLLVDGVIPAGSLNSSAYLQGAAYNSQVSGTSQSYNFGGGGERGDDNMFDGDIKHSTAALGGGDITWSGSISFTTSFAIASDNDGGSNAINITHGPNNTVTNVRSQVPDTTNSQIAAGTIPITTLTGITSPVTGIQLVEGGVSANGICMVKADGKIVVDSGITVSNVPAVDCRVTANQNAGFSVVKVDNPTTTESRAHGLTQAPELILAKSTANAAENWHIFHTYYGSARYGIFGTNGFTASDQWGSSEPDANQFFVKPATGSGANYAGGMIYYIWHSVPGYSSFGAFTGNGSADGPYVYTGHRPRWLLLKQGSANGQNWVIFDSKRNPYNVAGKQLYPNLSIAEADSSADTHARVDFLSNGFKIRGSHTSINTSTEVILYASFASHPFKLSNAV